MVALHNSEHPQYVEAGRKKSVQQQDARIAAITEFTRGRKVYVNGDKSTERSVDGTNKKHGTVDIWIGGKIKSYHPSVLELIPVPEK